MQRQQDTNLWSQTGIFSATNGVLIVALFSAMGKVATESELEVYFGFVGLVLCLCWFLIAARASSRAFWYKHLAERLQNDLRIPEKHKFWNEDVPGIKSVSAYWVLVLTFGGIWAWSALYGASQICFTCLAVSSMLVAIVGATAGWAYLEWRTFGRRVTEDSTSNPESAKES